MAAQKYYAEVATESRQWIHTLKFFDTKSQDAFDRCDFPKLTYPYPDRVRSRTGCDLMTVFYVFDEYTDVEDEHITREMANILMDGLRNPDKPRPKDESPLGEMARQYWALGRKTATPMAQRHFIETMQLYVDGVVQQSEDRTHDRIRSVDGYWEVRRQTSGCLPTFALIELELDFPEEVYNHPLLGRLRDCALYSICAGNDIYSYSVERARGHALHNLVTIIMYAHDLSPQAAVNWIGGWHDWSFESHRFFGTQGLEIQKTREIRMLPRVEALTSRSLTHRSEVEAEKYSIAAMQILLT